MKPNFFIIQAKIEGCRKTMYFTGTAQNGNPLFSTQKSAAQAFLSRDAATSVRLSVAPQNSQLEQLETINYEPPKNKQAAQAV